MTGYVYVMGSDQWPYVKIGYSKDPAKRLWFVQVGSPVRLELLATYEGGRALEAALHRYFAQYRMSGEWFDLGSKAVERIGVAVDMGITLLLARDSNREREPYSLVKPAAHPVTGREFAPEHREWFQPWPDLDTRFPLVHAAEGAR
ncbi:GIY-YIG nuclease family protein [Streptomyces sp. NPDC047082]|uniref:GIY-YIG nuclease family protein n=1 Tax=Streptomyces sp. NPDC047082 TaxID=3155259 RepID=UPI0034064D7B